MRAILLSLLFVAACGLGFVALWLARGALGGWAVPLALAWVVLVSKAFAVGLALAASDER